MEHTSVKHASVKHASVKHASVKHVHVIVNPAAGTDRPILNTLNRVLRTADIDWSVSVTRQSGDAQRQAEEAAAAGVDAVAVYGGDGTVMEAATGLLDTDVPLAILPGGTANVMSAELGIPADLAQAATLLCGAGTIRTADMGTVNDHRFLLRVGVGLEAAMVKGADRELKDRVGPLAYALSAFQAVREPEIAHYHLTLDGRSIDTDGLTCIIANSGNLGLPGLSLVPTIDISDGLLDVIVIRRADLNSLLSMAANVIQQTTPAEPLQHWQVRQVTVVTDPPQSAQSDGEVIGQTPVTASVVPEAVRIVVPADTVNTEGGEFA